MGYIHEIRGAIVIAKDLFDVNLYDLCEVGNFGLIGEAIKIIDDKVIIQVFEDTEGLKPFEEVKSLKHPLSIYLGPGILGNIYDGIQRPLSELEKISGYFISRGIKTFPLKIKEWKVEKLVEEGTYVKEGEKVAFVQETSLIKHYLMIPHGLKGKIYFKDLRKKIQTDQDYAELITDEGEKISLKMYQIWPSRKPRPYKKRLSYEKPLFTGLRVIDTFFPVALGGTAAIPGGFGTGKTMVQQSLAKWSAADIIVYVGCGERGNEMTDVLEQFPKLTDPFSGKPLMERTILVANTSNMPVAAREISIYTGVTIAEYFRDMGYNVAMVGDSTSRWAEALRELGGRLEEMPAEEGFPSYLPSRLASFYERAAYVETLAGEKGSVTIIGAVSPPGGDFSEPVTQHTKRFVRTYWELDRNLAYERHYPAISWLNSYTEYLDEIIDFYNQKDPEFKKYRNAAMEILQKEEKLQRIVKLIGPDALPDLDKLTLRVASLLKQGFLQQNAFDEIDRYCFLEKQISLLKLIIDFYRVSIDILKKGITLVDIFKIKEVHEIVRLKSKIPNDQYEKIDEFKNQLILKINSLM